MRYIIIDGDGLSPHALKTGTFLTEKQALDLFKKIWDTSRDRCYEKFNNSMMQNNLNTVPDWEEFKKTL